MKPIMLAAGVIGVLASGISGLVVDAAEPALAARGRQRPDPPDFEEVGGAKPPTEGDGLDVPQGGNRKSGGPVEDDGLDKDHAAAETRTMMRHQPVCSHLDVTGIFGRRYHFVVPDGMRFSAPGHGCGQTYRRPIENTCQHLLPNWQCVADGNDGSMTFGITVSRRCSERMMMGIVNKVTGNIYRTKSPCIFGGWAEARAAYQRSSVEMVEDPWHPGHWLERTEFQSRKDKEAKQEGSKPDPAPPLLA